VGGSAILPPSYRHHHTMLSAAHTVVCALAPPVFAHVICAEVTGGSSPGGTRRGESAGYQRLDPDYRIVREQWQLQVGRIWTRLNLTLMRPLEGRARDGSAEDASSRPAAPTPAPDCQARSSHPMAGGAHARGRAHMGSLRPSARRVSCGLRADRQERRRASNARPLHSRSLNLA